MIRIDRVVTRGGDKGETSLGDNTRVMKDALRVEAYGTVDEANAAIGMLRLHTAGDSEADAMLARVQNDLFDTGAGPQQRAALLRVAEQLGGAEEVLLLNSHGHLDHLGNNDVLAEIPAARRRHLFPRAARPGLDFEAFFGRMYRRGVPYFDYLTGLSIDPAAVASILRAVGADPGLTDADARRGGQTMGLASAASLAIGLELMPFLVIAGAAAVLRWVWMPADRDRLTHYGVALGAGCAAGRT